MKTEIEAKFLNVDFDDIRQRLTALGAVCEQPMRLMRRVLFDPPDLKEGRDLYIRVRDEGNKVTLTLKEFTGISLTGAQEREIVVSDFDETLAILAETGLIRRSFQESKRETWKLDDVEIVLDEWPWLEPSIEIEGPTEESVKSIAGRLGFVWEDSVFGSADELYKLKYPDIKIRGVSDIAEVRFDAPVPEVFGEAK